MGEHIWPRRQFLAGTAAVTLLGCKTGHAQGSHTPAFVSDPTLDAILAAGSWSTTAEDKGGNERLPEAVANSWVKASLDLPSSRQALVDLGALVLTLSVAEWGVSWSGSEPIDPRPLISNKPWTGPSSIKAGKHVMSYALGGLGLPHLDTQDSVQFFRHLASLLPTDQKLAEYVRQFPTGFHYDPVRAAGGMCDGHNAIIKSDIFGEAFHHDAEYWSGDAYCAQYNQTHSFQPAQWQAFRSWARLGLRRRDMQRWVVDTWINRYWLPAHDMVMLHPYGTLGEAFVVARIWNSGSGLALAAMNAAGTNSDPAVRVSLELDNYCNRKKTYRERRGVMQRPAAVYQRLARAA